MPKWRLKLDKISGSAEADQAGSDGVNVGDIGGTWFVKSPSC